MQRKILIGFLVLTLLVVTILGSGCYKQDCIKSGGTWRPGNVGVAGNSEGGCVCPTIDATTGRGVEELCALKGVCLPNNGGCSVDYD